MSCWRMVSTAPSAVNREVYKSWHAQSWQHRIEHLGRTYEPDSRFAQSRLSVGRNVGMVDARSKLDGRDLSGHWYLRPGQEFP